MDFLEKYNATMDCKAKIVSPRDQDSIVKFWGQWRANEKRWISALKADKLLWKGAYGYLAHVQERKEDHLKIGVLVVNEFKDVFPEELLGLSPQREIEFSIEVVPRTNPISIPFYKMVPQN